MHSERYEEIEQKTGQVMYKHRSTAKTEVIETSRGRIFVVSGINCL